VTYTAQATFDTGMGNAGRSVLHRCAVPPLSLRTGLRYPSPRQSSTLAFRFGQRSETVDEKPLPGLDSDDAPHWDDRTDRPSCEPARLAVSR
jgi:hypothetical protein